ncbi:MAG: DUF6428 family protein [Flavobacteriaceae bacterium]|nr:DUF6428 family protein [Flavobacteriaceae bacterium]
MKTSEFLDLLVSNQSKKLQFAYKDGQFVAEDYHITEVKNMRIQGVNCGALIETWNETLIQLMDAPEQKEDSKPMTALKAMGILRKSDRILPMEPEALLKFEYGNADFHTAQMEVHSYTVQNDQLQIHLMPSATLCKAPEICNLPPAEEVEATSCCDPQSGCC